MMNSTITLESGVGTNLYMNDSQDLVITIELNDKIVTSDQEKILVIKGTVIKPLNLMGTLDNDQVSVKISPNEQYMVVNMLSKSIKLKFSSEIASHHILYNPYLYDGESRISFDPEKFKEDHTEFTIPDGYIDTLAKWYSVKYTYEKENVIFIRPGVGISFQTHKLRKEHWEVIYGKPIIISGESVYYDTKIGQDFDHPLGGMHTIINPSDKWVAIKETYTGKFDEEDIVRVYNPNNYGL